MSLPPWVQELRRAWLVVSGPGDRRWKRDRLLAVVMRWYRLMGINVPLVPTWIERRIVERYAARVIEIVLTLAERPPV